ncbi:carbon-nitrogen hydrolase family protein [Xanthocytophaga agilis]|uniref:Carbon-nitrogen hydrolase family protein n=1 Tax=Xanthocytophaga agilis TaxID=3048010 RepID=A0AAE3R495_9BACT|nr:carbon-nitrogen hydrolase family protein [Xanthocytophaga agilis]MDJ1501297.1 carbon-nitrogen hydrolase family protein [Xanthocytophaga agilis]
MRVKVAVVQETPVFFNLEATIQKMENTIAEYASQGCQLLVFPESFIPGYPRKFTFGSTIGQRSNQGRQLYQQYWENSLELPGKHLAQLEQIAKTHQIFLVTGITERDSINGSLYCTMIYISPNQGYMGKHRKIKPTGVERLVWAEGHGADVLTTVQTEFGKLGGLICWENYMPLARMALYQQGVQLYIAPTADARETWTATMQHVACEGRCFVIGCNQYFHKDDYPTEFQVQLAEDDSVLCRGGSVIVSPQGKCIAGPLWDKKGVLVAELDMDEVIQSKLDFDVIGHYSRPDLFTFTVKNSQ